MFKRLISLLLILLSLTVPALCEIIELPVDLSPGMEPNREYLSGRTYEDPSIRVEVTKVPFDDSKYSATYYYARVKIANATQLRTAPARSFDSDKMNSVDTIAKRYNAVLAINGDFYAARSRTYVLRQGVVYQDTVWDHSDVLLIDEDGDFHVILASEDPQSADKTVWEGKKIINAFDFGPALIRNNEVVLDKDSSPDMSKPDDYGQRMCIAQTGRLEYLIVCCSNNTGLKVDAMCELVQSLSDNIIAAYMLDGGNSTQMILMGEKVNSTRDNVNVRKLSDIVYFASAYVPDGE